MGTTLKELEKLGRIRRFASSKEDVQSLIQVAERDVTVSKKSLTIDSDWAFSQAYNSILQACRAWLFANNWREGPDAGHTAALDFAQATLGKGFEELLLFDYLRKKRRSAVYSRVGEASGTEALHALKTAESFLGKIRKKVLNIRRLDSLR